MSSLHGYPDPFAARGVLECLHQRLMAMTDLVSALLEGECSPYARCTAEEFYQRWGTLVTVKEHLENELKKIVKQKNGPPDRASSSPI